MTQKRFIAAFLGCTCLAGVAHADQSSVVDRTKSALKHGAEATAHGIERGAKATGHGIKVGLDATAYGIERGAQATSRVMHKIADKIASSS
jgi:hypothetical protein